MKPLMIRIGNFFFHYRNRAFPIIMIAIFAISPPLSTIMGSTWFESMKDYIAVAVAFTGLALRGLVIGFAYIKRGGMNKKVYAENLVTQGVFGICRNPLYVGNMLIYTGVFIMHGNPLVMVLGIATFLFIYQCIIYAEEAYLENKFGDGYKAYCKDVPRWIPHFSAYAQATEGMEFNFRRVLVKDYTTVATTVIMLSLTECYEYIASEGTAHIAYLVFLLCVILVTGILTLVIRTLKKRRILSEHAS